MGFISLWLLGSRCPEAGERGRRGQRNLFSVPPASYLGSERTLSEGDPLSLTEALKVFCFYIS